MDREGERGRGKRDREGGGNRKREEEETERENNKSSPTPTFHDKAVPASVGNVGIMGVWSRGGYIRPWSR